MKSCPKCKQTYADNSLVFCLEDGTPLSAPFDQNATLHLPNVQTKPPSPDTAFEFPGNKINDGARQKKKNLSWLLLAASAIVIIGLVSLLGLFLILSFMNPTRTVVYQPTNTNQAQTGTSPAPIKNESEEIETELRRLNDDITNAFERADTDFLQRHLADNYLFQDDRGTRNNKARTILWLSTSYVDYESVTASDVKVRLESNKQKATLTGYGQLRWRYDGKLYSDQFNFTNFYEKRGGVWQLVSINARH